LDRYHYCVLNMTTLGLVVLRSIGHFLSPLLESFGYITARFNSFTCGARNHGSIQPIY
jgi:hypothetical protein